MFSAHAGKRAGSHVLSEVRASVRAECACGLARAEQRQVLIPHGVERHHAARGFWARGRGWAEDGMARPCWKLEILGAPMTFIFSETFVALWPETCCDGSFRGHESQRTGSESHGTGSIL